MTKWPVTVAFTDDEAEALAALADEEFDGDRDAAIRSVLDEWLGERGGRASRFRR